MNTRHDQASCMTTREEGKSMVQESSLTPTNGEPKPKQAKPVEPLRGPVEAWMDEPQEVRDRLRFFCPVTGCNGCYLDTVVFYERAWYGDQTQTRRRGCPLEREKKEPNMIDIQLIDNLYCPVFKCAYCRRQIKQSANVVWMTSTETGKVTRGPWVVHKPCDIRFREETPARKNELSSWDELTSVLAQLLHNSEVVPAHHEDVSE